MKTLERPNFEGEKKPENKAETEAKYNFEAIAELEKPMANLVEQLKEAIDSGEYDTLISDDAGGRIPTLVMREVMMARMRKMHPDFTPEQEREAMKTFFVAGGSVELNHSALKETFDKAGPKIKKALLVTEFMSSGKSMRQLGDFFESMKIDFDIATAITEHYRHEYRGGVYDHRRFYIGKERARVPKIYFRKEETGGVIKIPAREGARLEIDKTHRKNVMDSRQYVDLMAKRILEKVWGNKDN